MMRRYDGAYMLSHTWSSILERPTHGGRPDPLVKFERSVTSLKNESHHQVTLLRKCEHAKVG